MATKEKLEEVRLRAIETGFYSPVPEEHRWINQIGLPTDLRDLKDNWDGYGAGPLDPELLKAVGYTSIVPGGDGSVQFEFRSGGKEVNVHFDASGQITYVYVEGDVLVETGKQ